MQRNMTKRNLPFNSKLLFNCRNTAWEVSLQKSSVYARVKSLQIKSLYVGLIKLLKLYLRRVTDGCQMSASVANRTHLAKALQLYKCR